MSVERNAPWSRILSRWWMASSLFAAFGIAAIVVSSGPSTPLTATPTAGSVLAWGESENLGNGTGGSKSTPVQVLLPTGVTATAIAGGDNAGYAIGTDGHVYAWGEGPLGNESTSPAPTPVQVALPAGIKPVAIAEGCSVGYVIGSDSHIYAWYGSSMPSEIALPKAITATAVAGACTPYLEEGGLYGYGYAIGSDGNVYTWAFGTPSVTGNPTDFSAPTEIAMPSGVAARTISAGEGLAYAIGSDGNLYLLTGSAASEVDYLPSGVTVTAITVGWESAFALGSDGNVYSWGTGPAYPGLEVTPPLASSVSARAMAGVNDSTSVDLIGSNGAVYSWSRGVPGSPTPTPVEVSLPTGVNVDAVAVGANNLYALVSSSPIAQLAPGQTLAGGQSVSVGVYSLVMQTDGNLVEYGPAGALWASNTAGNPGADAVMQGDGNLVVYSSTDHPLWASNTAGNPGAYAVLSSTGTFSVLTSAGGLLWSA
jgi:hypothetical protein